MKPRWNHAIWLGPVITVAATITYFTTFARFPTLRDFPWLNLPLAAAGLLISGWGLLRAFQAGRGVWGKVLAPLGLLVSLGFAGLFGYYIFALSYRLPPPSEVATGLGQAPDFELIDQRGDVVRLSELRGRKVLLTFYRGHW